MGVRTVHGCVQYMGKNGKCLSQHGLKQIKLCFNSRAGCEAALRSDGRLSVILYPCWLG